MDDSANRNTNKRTRCLVYQRGSVRGQGQTRYEWASIELSETIEPETKNIRSPRLQWLDKVLAYVVIVWDRLFVSRSCIQSSACPA